MLNISSIKELLRKPLKIQRNITRNLPEKLKRKIFGLYFLANFLYFFFWGGGGEILRGPVDQCRTQWFLIIL